MSLPIIPKIANQLFGRRNVGADASSEDYLVDIMEALACKAMGSLASTIRLQGNV